MAGPLQRFLDTKESSCVGKYGLFQIDIISSSFTSKLFVECIFSFFPFCPCLYKWPQHHNSWGQGGVIHPSAPYWQERFVFILEQSVCLFIKGVDQNTPQPAPHPPHTHHLITQFTVSAVSAIQKYPLFPPLFLYCSSSAVIIPVWSYSPLLRLWFFRF